MSDAFDTCLAFTLREEGGFSDRADDPGGATQAGVTLRLLTDWRHAKDQPTPTIEDLRGLGREELTAIYSVEFFSPLRGHDLPPGIDLMAFDFGVNAGPKRAAIQLQRVLGFTGSDVDGWVGPRTITAARKIGVLTVLSVLAALQQEYYFGSANYPTFGTGWLARTNRRLLAAWDMSRAAVSVPLIPPPPAAAA